MLRRTLAAAMLMLSIAACGGAPATAVTPTDRTASPAGSGPAPTTSASSGAGIDLTGVQACSLIDDATVTAVTGQTGFLKDSRENTHCFWGVPRAPQYLEIRLDRRPGGIGDYQMNFEASTCTSVPVSAAGFEAKGADCVGPQHKVYVLLWANGVMLSVLVNEPPAATTPASLIAIAQGVFASLQ
jgi:hypothetical protein